MYIIKTCVSELNTWDEDGGLIRVPMSKWAGPFKYLDDVYEFVRTNEVLEVMEID